MLIAGPSIVHATLAHTINVLVHVAFGTAALLLGLVPILTSKGSRIHRRFGRYFLMCLDIVIVTAGIGIFVFSFRAFLAVITLLAAYDGYSGYRVVQTTAAGPQHRDAIVAMSALAAVGVFLVYLRRVHMPWSPMVIYSTLGALVLMASYDLVRLLFPKRWFAGLWIYEHLVKMLAAYSAVLSAFAGTVLVRWQPYSQMVPTAVSTCAMVGFGVQIARQRRRGNGPEAARVSVLSERFS